MSCRQQLAPPLINAAKMSPRISICQEPVLADHAQSPPAAGSHCPAREGSAPHWEQNSSLVRWVDAWGCGGGRAAAWASSGRGQLQQACGFAAV
jgi:hypothetical protein